MPTKQQLRTQLLLQHIKDQELEELTRSIAYVQSLGAPLSDHIADGLSLLEEAVRSNQPEMLEQLLPFLRTWPGYTAWVFLKAAQTTDEPLARTLINALPDCLDLPAVVNAHAQSTLRQAVPNNNVFALQELWIYITSYVTSESILVLLNNLFKYAVNNNQLNCAEFFIRQGYVIDESWVDLCSENGYINWTRVDFFIAHEVDFAQFKNRYQGRLPDFYFSISVVALQAFLEQQPNLLLINNNGQSVFGDIDVEAAPIPAQGRGVSSSLDV